MGLGGLDVILKLPILDDLKDVSNLKQSTWVWWITQGFPGTVIWMWLQSYVMWLCRTFSPVYLPSMLPWVWMLYRSTWEYSPWGQVSPHIHHCIIECIISFLDILLPYKTSGRLTRVPPVFTDHIFLHLMSHQGWSIFYFVVRCISIGI